MSWWQWAIVGTVIWLAAVRLVLLFFKGLDDDEW